MDNTDRDDRSPGIDVNGENQNCWGLYGDKSRERVERLGGEGGVERLGGGEGEKGGV